jgi:uncharacterized RDD family membrane protein YckC
MSAARVPYAGIVSRAIALALDMAIVQLVLLACAAILALVASLVGDIRLDTTGRVLSVMAWVGAVGVYFVAFWTTVGQTPAMRLMDIRVVTDAGDPPGAGRSIVRLIGLGLAIIPLFAGFLPVLVDDRRRALQDYMAGTVVVHADAFGIAAPA